ncbi:MAG: hypothetical protein INQ03_05575 [Candidatus Heimdallarchaeota archaeon]|nr:hypothetical protein [Candidatus Heimdallarchaeota archaeon]
MIIGFMVIGKHGFVSFEHYFENISQFIESKEDFFAFLEKTNYEPGIYKMDKIAFRVVEEEEFKVGILYLQSKLLNSEHKEKILEISKLIAIGDKEIIELVFKSRYISDLI